MEDLNADGNVMIKDLREIGWMMWLVIRIGLLRSVAALNGPVSS
jgi:hypothetical protein